MPKRPDGSGGMYNSRIMGGHIIRAEWHVPFVFNNRFFTLPLKMLAHERLDEILFIILHIYAL